MIAVPFMRGGIIPLEGGGNQIMFQWNPAQISGPNVKPKYAEIEVAGREVPYLQYSNGSTITYTFDLDVSRGDNGPGYVKGVVEALSELTRPTIRGQGMNRAPRVLFIFGSLFSKVCVIAEVSPVYKGLFNPLTLDPYEAMVHIVLNEYRA